MSILVGDAVKGAVQGLGEVADALFTSDDERLTHAEVMERIKQKPFLAQIALNSVEAAHRTVFVAGWRPFIGWVCGFALAYHFIIHSLISWFILVACSLAGAPEIAPPPQISIGELISILLAMLGMSGLRTREKQSGAAH